MCVFLGAKTRLLKVDCWKYFCPGGVRFVIQRKPTFHLKLREKMKIRSDIAYKTEFYDKQIWVLDFNFCMAMICQ